MVVKETITFLELKSISFFIPFTKLCRFLCVIITPFGFPVEPEVYIKYANVLESILAEGAYVKELFFSNKLCLKSISIFVYFTGIDSSV